MITHTSLESVKTIKNPVVTTGTFDGVHLGHQKILRKLKRAASKCDGETVLFTFYPHPRMVLFPDDPGLMLINTIEEKKKLLSKAGLDHLILYPFSNEFSRLSALQYVRDILVNQINVHTIIVGYDHHFGKNREGDIHLLKELSHTFDFKVKEISALDIDEVNVSSTKVRNAISQGMVEKASDFLGYDFFFSGKVIRGDQRGRELGYKTANIEIGDKTKLIPSSGVFACRISHEGKKYAGMLNIGSNPTFKKGDSLHIETHILDFDEDIYGEQLKIELVCKLRDEVKFDSFEKLAQQLKMDESVTRDIFS